MSLVWEPLPDFKEWEDDFPTPEQEETTQEFARILCIQMDGRTEEEVDSKIFQVLRAIHAFEEVN